MPASGVGAAAAARRGIAAAGAVLQACEPLASRCCRCACKSRLCRSSDAIAAGSAANDAGQGCAVRCRCAMGDHCPLARMCRLAGRRQAGGALPPTAAYATTARSLITIAQQPTPLQDIPDHSSSGGASLGHAWPRARSPSASAAGLSSPSRAPPRPAAVAAMAAAAAAQERWCLRRRPGPQLCAACWASRYAAMRIPMSSYYVDVVAAV